MIVAFLWAGCAAVGVPGRSSPTSEVVSLRGRIAELHDAHHELRRTTTRRQLRLDELDERAEVLAAELTRVRAFRQRLDAAGVTASPLPLPHGDIPVAGLTMAEALGVGRLGHNRGPEHLYLYRTDRGLAVQVFFRPLDPDRRALLGQVMQAWEVMDEARRGFAIGQVRARESRAFDARDRAWQNAARAGRSYHVELVAGRYHVVDLISFRRTPQWQDHEELERRFQRLAGVGGTLHSFLPRHRAEEPVEPRPPEGWIETPRKIARAPTPKPTNVARARTLTRHYEREVVELVATADAQHWSRLRLEAELSSYEVDLDAERRGLYEILYSLRPALDDTARVEGPIDLWQLSLFDALGMRALDDILEADRWLFHRGRGGVTALELDRVPDEASRTTAAQFLECLASDGESRGCMELLARLRDEGFGARILGWTPRRAHRLIERWR